MLLLLYWYYDYVLIVFMAIQLFLVSNLGEYVMKLFLSLQLIFDSARNLETFLSILRKEEDIITRVQYRSVECIKHMITDISQQTALYTSKLLQVLQIEVYITHTYTPHTVTNTLIRLLAKLSNTHTQHELSYSLCSWEFPYLK